MKTSENRTSRPLRICVCTSYGAHQEPRAPRHARALAGLPNVQLTFVDSLPEGSDRVAIDALRDLSDLQWHTFHRPHRDHGLPGLIRNRICGRLADTAFRLTGSLQSVLVNPSLLGYGRLVGSVPADIYMAHNIDTLLPAWQAARKHGGLLIFDSMEFHSDMGDGQSATERQMIRAVERTCLPDCQLITASSPEVGQALEEEYGLQGIVPLYNTPPRTSDLAERQPGFNLYWRNSVVGFGQRGLDDVLQAMRQLPTDIHLHLQGRPANDGGESLRQTIAEYELSQQVTIHPPYKPENAVREASRFQVGLCLERECNRNHDLTVSNKMFDYHMAGLAVVSSDLPGLRNVIETSGGGSLFRAGCVDSLRDCLLKLYQNPSQLAEQSARAQTFGLERGNLEYEMSAFMAAVSDQVLSQLPHHPESAVSRAA